MAPHAGFATRRTAITRLLAGALMLLLGIPASRAETADLVKAASWQLGDQISLAGMLYAQGGQDDNVEQLLTSIKPLAEAMQIEIKPFPPRGATPTDTYASIIQYLIKGDGAELGQEIAGKFGNDAGTLYEVAIKSNLLLLLRAGGRPGYWRSDSVPHGRGRRAGESVDRRAQRHQRQGAAGHAERGRVQDA